MGPGCVFYSTDDSHNPASKESLAIASYLKKKQDEKWKYDIEITEQKPTSDQVKAIMGFASPDNAEMLKKHGFVRPLLVDWHHGKIAVNDESSAKKIIDELSKSKFGM